MSCTPIHHHLEPYRSYVLAAVALAELHEIVTKGRGGKNELFALAEFSFLHAQNKGKRQYYLAVAVYAYAFLFPERNEDSPGPLDPRTRLAADTPLEPYLPGKIPVVFVHGTASSPARRADMANDLRADPWIRQHYQFLYLGFEAQWNEKPS
ncbi:MAG: hypothetical protein Q7U57_12740 [Methylovulum sp.]|nr:hypothetical protein [Methylovulum sp.]